MRSVRRPRRPIVFGALTAPGAVNAPKTARALLAAALVAVLFFAGAAGVQAAPPTGDISSPAEGAEITVAADVQVAVSFQAPGSTGRITDVVVTLESKRGGGFQKLADEHGLSQPTYGATWNEFALGVLDYNGEYVVTADVTAVDAAVDTDGPETVRRTRTFYLAVPPVQPQSVTAQFNESKRTVAVTWTGNPEPDLLGYVVQRAPAGGSYSHLAEVEAGQTSYTDDAEELDGGDYSYRVVALREGALDLNASPEGVEVLNSDPSAPATASVAAPPTTTTESTSTTGSGGEGSTGPGASESTTSSSQPAFESQGRVDLSGFASLLDQARTRPAPRPTVADPGFTEELPYGTRPPGSTAAPTTGRPEVEIALADDDDDELGEEDRLRSMTVLAGGLFAFVLFMHAVWIRTEVKHAPLPVEDAGEPHDDAPGEDPPEDGEKADGTLASEPRKRSQRARGAADRVPPRSRGDRREGRPALRAGGRGPRRRD